MRIHNNPEKNTDCISRKIPILRRSEGLLSTSKSAETVQLFKDSENTFKTLFEQSSDAKFLLIDGVFVECNKTALTLLKCRDKSQIIGKRPIDLSPEKQSDGSISAVRTEELFTIPSGQETHKFRWDHQGSDGEIIHVEVVLTAITLQETSVVHVQWKDLSEQNKIQRALIEKEKQYKGLVATLPEVVFVHRHDIVLFVNQAVTAILGYTPLEIIGTSATGYVDESYRKVVRANMEKHMADIAVGDYEVKLRTKAGYKIPVLVRSQTIIYDESPAILTIFFDVTERKKIEEQLRHSQKMEAVGQLAGGVAHDFNNIITAIMGYGTLALQKMAPYDPLRPYIDTILSLSERAGRLTGSLLAFSRKQPIILSPIDLNTPITGIEKLLTKLLTEDIELSISPAANKLIVMADIHQIEQVIMNLVVNARDAMPEGGKLCISAYEAFIDNSFKKTCGHGKPRHYGVISVSDNGIGMDKKTKERVFEPFFTTKEVGKGTGLGLATAYGIIEQHNGHITVDTSPGQGATFNIYIPLNTTPIQHIEHKELTLSLRKGCETILIVEDDEEVRRLYRTILEEYGYTIIEAKDGLDAIDRFTIHKDAISLVILDVVLPKKNGKEVYENIKKIEPSVQVLFMSGYTADIVNSKGIVSEGVDFIAKPVKTETLIWKIRKLLDKEQSSI